jgi:hypothetical protein
VGNSGQRRKDAAVCPSCGAALYPAQDVQPAVPIELPPPRETMIRGYRVRVTYRNTSPQDAAVRGNIILGIVVRNLMKSLSSPPLERGPPSA